MRYYSYVAVTAEGKAIKGAVEADDEATVQDILEQRGLYPVRINPVRAFFSNSKKLLIGRKVKRIEVIEFAQNLSVMIRAGVSIMSSLSDIIETTKNPTFAEVLLDIRQNVGNGARFADAIERHDTIFPPIFVRLVRVGEETGQFEGSLAEIAGHLKKVEAVATAIKQALIYPVFAIVTTLGSLMFWMVYVLPKVIVTLKGVGGRLPLLTRGLMMASAYSRKYWYLYIIVPVMVAVLLKMLKRKESFRYHMDRIILKMPILKDLMYYRSIALFAEQMRILIRSGMTIDKSFDLVAEVIGNEVFKRSLIRVKEAVILGRLISDSLKAEKIYPVLVVRMVKIGENSGTLDNQFAFLSDHYSTKLDNFSASLGKIIEPLVIIVVGFIFAVIILGLMLPIYDMVSHIGTGGSR